MSQVQTQGWNIFNGPQELKDLSSNLVYSFNKYLLFVSHVLAPGEKITSTCLSGSLHVAGPTGINKHRDLFTYFRDSSYKYLCSSDLQYLLSSRGWQTFFVKAQLVNILGFVGPDGLCHH